MNLRSFWGIFLNLPDNPKRLPPMLEVLGLLVIGAAACAGAQMGSAENRRLISVAPSHPVP